MENKVDVLSQLPEDVVKHQVFSYLNVYEMLNVSMVNHSYYNLVNEEKVWRHRCVIDFGSNLKNENQDTWKTLYKKEYENNFSFIFQLLKYNLGFSTLFRKSDHEDLANSRHILNPNDDTKYSLSKLNPGMKGLFKKKQEEINQQLKMFGQFRWMIFALVGILILIISETLKPDFFDYPYLYWVPSFQKFIGILQNLIPFFVFVFLFTLLKIRLDHNKISKRDDDLISFNDETTILSHSAFRMKLVSSILKSFIQEVLFRYVYVCCLMIFLLFANKLIEILAFIIIILSLVVFIHRIFSNLHHKFLTAISGIIIRSMWMYFHWKLDIVFGLLWIHSELIHFLTFQNYRNLIFGSEQSKMLFVSSMVIISLHLEPLVTNTSKRWFERLYSFFFSLLMIHLLLLDGLLVCLLVNLISSFFSTLIYHGSLLIFANFKQK
jgi:hypothetical protein